MPPATPRRAGPLFAALAYCLAFPSAALADEVTSFTLINADNDQAISAFDPLLDGATLNLATLPTTNLNVRANTAPATVGSVRFALNGNNNFRTENSAPYALAGDSGGNYGNWTPSVGANTLTATAYTGSGAGGTAGTPLTINFNVVNQTGNDPPSININSPADGATFSGAPLDVDITVTAADSDGTVAKVEFYEAANKLGESTTPPFSFTWQGVAAGNYQLTAVATDDESAVTTSAAVQINVDAPPPGQVADTNFSHRRGFYDAPFLLTISTETAGATIVYTTDGSEPTTTNGTEFTNPISIDSTTVLRAFAYKAGDTPTNIDTQTYLFIDDVIGQTADIPGYPRPTYWLGGSQSNTAVHDYEMDPAIVTSPAYASLIDDALLAIPSMSIVSDPGEIFGNGGFYDGTNVEEKVSVEVLYPDAPGDNEQAEAGIEAHSHKRMKRSLRLNFRSEYGDAKLRSDLFRKAPLGGDSATDRFDRLILRAGNNRSWARVFSKEKTTYAIDEFARQSQIAMSGHGMHGAFVHLYINGIYWGLYNPVERADHWFTSEYFGGEPADWFSLNHGGDLSGIDDRYDYLKGALKDKDMSNAANYAELGDYLALSDFIDYLLVQWYTATGDWPQNNWYGGNRNPSSPLGATPHQYFLWDAEWSWDLPHSSANNPPPYDPWVHPDFRAGDGTGFGNNKAIANVFNAAKASPAFLRLFADRVYEHFFEDGVMSEPATLGRWTTLTDYLRLAVIAESARWGDTLEGMGEPTFTRDDHWETEVAAITSLMTGRNDKFITKLRAEGYYPSIDPPSFSQHGGEITPGLQLTMSNPNGGGTIFFTLDGSDPDSPGASTYNGAIPLSEETEVRARVQAPGGEWSALHRAVFTLPSPPPLRITEIMYHPAAPTAAEAALGFTDQDLFEFIEFRNIGNEELDLSGMAFNDGIAFVFPQGSSLAAGEYGLLVADAAAFEARFGTGLNVLGVYSGNLRNSGENVGLATALGQTVHLFDYEDDWYPLSDGPGHSLRILDEFDPDLERWDKKFGWFASATPGGTPGSGETLLFDAWRMLHFQSLEAPGTSALESMVGDSISNLLKYALNLDPNDNALISEVVVFGASGGEICLSYPRDTSKTDIVYRVQSSVNLIDWNPVADTLEANSDGIEIRKARIPIAAAPRSSLRLEIELQ